jgi:hypothetical protein
MIPNDQHDADSRFRRLAEAVRLVYASMFFERARRSMAAAKTSLADEKMAVIIQEVVGRRHGTRFYPDVSGVARSLGFYRSSTARPEDGIALLALGLGKTIVDGGVAWTYSPAYPRRPAPFATAAELLDRTQTAFWAVLMAGRPRYDPVSEVEYLVRPTLADAEADQTLHSVASTYDAASDRFRAGIVGSGPRAVTFAPLLVLEEHPINDVIRELLALGRSATGAPVEIEFAFTFDAQDLARPSRCGFLQVRPMAVSAQAVDVAADQYGSADCVVASESVLGNGVATDIADIVFVARERFTTLRTRVIGEEIAAINRELVAEGRPYLLIGFGRWGTSDPFLGIPTDWADISGARVVVEATLPGLNAEPSQGSHFFHNLSGAGVLYFSVRPDLDPSIDWAWIESRPLVRATDHARHVRLDTPLEVRVDGRTGRGVVLRGGLRS